MQLHRQEASPDDIAMIDSMLPECVTRPESFERDTYLNELVPKPWGHEYRVYCDAMYDIWQLRIEAGRRTSLHCHLNKDTVLLCLGGSGEISFLDGRSQPIEAGVSVYIRRGAFHTTCAGVALDLIEVENPRNKFDLLRAQDSYGRVQAAYETAWQSSVDLAPLQRIHGTRALVRPRDLGGAHLYGCSPLSAEDLLDGSLAFVVLAGVEQHLAGEITALGGQDPGLARHLSRKALLVRRATAQPGIQHQA